MRRYTWIMCVLFFLPIGPTYAQKAAVKTNLLYDATTTLNLGIEIGVAPKWSVDLSGNLNPWTFSNNTKWKHWLIQPEARYWLCERFNGHFLGAHVLGGIYNIGNVGGGFKFLGTDFGQLADHRYEGWMLGAGIAYGYQWMLSRHWNLEASVGIGYDYIKYDKYECGWCGEKIKSSHSNYFGPTKAALSFLYIF